MDADRLKAVQIDLDGTSQTDRRRRALDPDFVKVDERTTHDLIETARAIAAELVFFDSGNRPAGSWDRFIPDSLPRDLITTFAAEPGRFSTETTPELFRPHLTLFLAFLRLLESVRHELNGFTRRHLEFYYEQVLRLEPREAGPDRVNLFAELARSASPTLVPEGTHLQASPDVGPQARTYVVDRDLLVTRAQVERLSTIHLEREVVGLREARLHHRNDPERLAIALFQTALGRPGPGDALLPYPGPGGIGMAGEQLNRIETLIAFAEQRLHLRLFELRDMMALKLGRDAADAEWDTINHYLAIAAAEAGNALRIDDPRAFDNNLRAALGGTIPTFDDVPEVDTIYDAFELRGRPEVQDAIRRELHFARLDDFTQMMHLKVGIDNEWQAINVHLDRAGGRRTGDPAWTLATRSRPPFDPADFETNLATAIGSVAYPDHLQTGDVHSLDSYHSAVEAIDRYFRMQAEEVLYVLRSSRGDADPERADNMLRDAYRSLVYADRRQVLQDIHESANHAAMLRFVLGEEPAMNPDPGLLSRLEPYLGSPGDLAVLASALEGDVDDWQRVYAIAEIAQRNREGRPEPLPMSEEWIALHPALDATAVSSHPDDTESPRWPLFGQVDGVERATDDSPVLALAIASPLLQLDAGRRVVTLTLGLDAVPGDAHDLSEAFIVELTSDAGWVPHPATVSPPDTFGSYFALTGTRDSGQGDRAGVQFRVELDEMADPVSSLAEDVAAYGSPWPAIRLRVRTDEADGRRRMRYPAVRHLRLSSVHLGVEVQGLVPSQLRNDRSKIDPTAPFEPFGPAPVVGSRLNLGHPELSRKKLDRLVFRPTWMGVPPNLSSGHYRHYPIGSTPNFTVDFLLVDRNRQVDLFTGARLISSSSEETPIQVDDLDEAVGPHPYRPLPAGAIDGDVTQWDRYLAWELKPIDFQHGAYASVAAERAIRMASDIANEVSPITPANYQVNPPYTPMLKQLLIDYTSSAEIDIATTQNEGEAIDLVHLHPFGFSRQTLTDQPRGIVIIPAYESEGELYIGLSGVEAPETVSLLFQLADGSGDPDLEPTPVRWSFASGGDWRPLDPRSVRVDTTRNLTASGIIELALPVVDDPTLPSDDLYWLRAAVERNTGATAAALAVHTQGVAATLLADGPTSFDEPLAPNSIAGPVSPLAGISAIHQPYGSYGGRPAEDEQQFMTRISERLRHKRRAVNSWDYEHLVLDRFPQIYKAKCIPAGADPRRSDPGTIDVIVIPDIRRNLPFESLEPKAGPALLAEIHDYLAERAPSWATIRVSNAHFVAVRARLAVRFSAGNEAHYKQRLVDDLDRHLSPWAYDEGADIVIGSKIFANSLIDFIDRQPYVDFVANLALFTSDDGVTYEPAPRTEDGGPGYHVDAGRPDGVLRASRDHVIDVLLDSDYSEELNTGIGFMRVELDLKVAG